MADYAAEIEVRSDGEAEREELTNYDEVQDYQVPTRGWCPSLQGDSENWTAET